MPERLGKASADLATHVIVGPGRQQVVPAGCPYDCRVKVKTILDLLEDRWHHQERIARAMTACDLTTRVRGRRSRCRLRVWVVVPIGLSYGEFMGPDQEAGSSLPSAMLAVSAGVHERLSRLGRLA